MLRPPYSSASRLIPSLTIGCLLALPPAFAATALGDDANAPVPAPAPAGADQTDRQLRNDVDAYFHYAWIGRYDLASQFAQKIVDETTDPASLIPVLEDTAKLHDPNMGYMSQLLLFDNQADLKEATDKLLLQVQAGNVKRAQDPALIEKTIRDMADGERAYENNIPNLRHSGELAIPIMIQFLRLDDDQHRPYRGVVRRALLDMGKPALNPLLAATDMKDYDALLTVVDTLGYLGYDVAAPYLTKISKDQTVPEGVRNAATSALGRLQITTDQSSDTAKMFYDLALRFYYDSAQIGQVINNPGTDPSAPIQTCNYWTWDADKGLVRAEVPASIFDDLMAMRQCDQALTLQSDYPEAVSLWLDADNKREADLPAGATDPVRGDEPPAHYFNVSAGARHLDDALARALKDRNGAVVLKLTRSLGRIIGRSALPGEVGQPLTDALRFPDKRVRYEAACALASELPDKPFANQQWVVPLLVEAIGEGGQGNLLVLGPNQDDANALQDILRRLGYVTAAAGSPEDAVAAAGTLPTVDAIVYARGVQDETAVRLITLASQTPELEDAVDVVLSDSATGPIQALTLNNPLVSLTTQTDGDQLKQAIEDARTKAGLAPLGADEATAYSIRAAQNVLNLAISQNAVLDLSVGEKGLRAALGGSNPELVVAIGRILAHFPTPSAQQAIAQRALDDQTPHDVRVQLFKSLAESAKAYGNQLDGGQVELVVKEAIELKDDALRSGAAEVRGALNLPTDEATNLILSQSGQPG